eukprot:TRINITY_DN636_c1_g1_i2.p1 TRINITY_DN636_c1_g1~~TRINITY_DN636_c1_g1_i2.p1  ORF type:complete len:308 (+),score=136.13 TRINITY_DN636_c1_g1_i2:351-1274(+)
MSSSLESPLDVLSRAASMVEESSSTPIKGVERSSSFKERIPKFRKSSTPEYLRAAARRSSKAGCSSDEEEGPLDMSMRKRERTPPPPYPLGFNLLPPPPSYEVAISKHNSQQISSESEEDSRPVREITIITDSCSDPLLDEHFRRSLGANYKSLFRKSPVSQEDMEDEESLNSSSSTPNSVNTSSTSINSSINSCSSSSSSNVNISPSSLSHQPPSSDKDEEERVRVIKAEDTERDHIVEMDKEGSTVEDHFAKALGETWIKLQAAAAANSSPSSSSSSTSKSSQSLSNPSSSPRTTTTTPQLVTTS